jgi:hypothetical protein
LNFGEKIMTRVEIYVFMFDPETKRQNLQWKCPEYSKDKKEVMKRGRNHNDLFVISKELSIVNLFLHRKQSSNNSSLKLWNVYSRQNL